MRNEAPGLAPPPWLENAEGQPRRVGLELEISGIELDVLAAHVADFLDLRVDTAGRYERVLKGDPDGDWIVELDFDLLKKLGREPREEGTVSADMAAAAEDVLAWAAEALVPLEVISPPLPLDRLSQFEALIEAANAYHARNKAEAFGIRGSEHLSIDLPAVMQRVRALHDRFIGGVLKSTEALGERSIAGRARLLGPNRLEVGDDTFHTRSIIIATGSSPVVPPVWRTLGDRLLTTDTFFEQETLPARMAVIGLGAIGVEMAQALSRLGVEVHAFGKGERIGGVSDPAVANAVRQALEQEFSIHTGHEVELTATANGVRVQAGPVDIEVDRVLAAVGRKPNLDGLGMETLGVALDERGLPPFDRTTLQIADLPVFIAGDANANASLLHEAADEGYIAGGNAVAAEPTCYRRRTPLAIVFSDPGIASVGQRFSDLDGDQCLTGSVDFASQGRALTAQRNQGVLRVYASAGDGRLLGAEMCAPAAQHLAHLLALAVDSGLTVHDLLAMPFYHPVLEEGLRTALREIAGKSALNRPDLSACSASRTEALD